jgi:hypothetical protein
VINTDADANVIIKTSNMGDQPSGKMIPWPPKVAGHWKLESIHTHQALGSHRIILYEICRRVATEEEADYTR